MNDLNLITTCQSGFRKCHTTATALVKIYDDFLKGFDNGNFVGAAFIDLRKVFDTVDHGILLKNLVAYAVGGRELGWFKSYLSNRIQQVKRTLSDEQPLTIGVPQGSIIEPLLFIIFMNDAPNVIKQILYLYAHDTTLEASDRDLSVLEQKLNEDLESPCKWLSENRLVLNTDKTVCMILSTHQCRATLTNCTLNLKVGDKHIKQVNEAKLLGIIIDENLTWEKHIYKMCNKISKILGLLKRLKKFIPSNTLIVLFNSLVLPHFDYANVVWGTACGTQIKYVYTLQKRAARILTGANRFSRTKPLFKKLNWMPLTERIQYYTAVLNYKARNFMTPQYLTSKFSTVAGQHVHATRLAQSSDLKVPQPNLELYIKKINYRGAVLWNSIQPSTRNADSVKAFKAGYCRSVLG